MNQECTNSYSTHYSGFYTNMCGMEVIKGKHLHEIKKKKKTFTILIHGCFPTSVTVISLFETQDKHSLLTRVQFILLIHSHLQVLARGYALNLWQ